MINCAILFDYSDKFVAVIGHDTKTGKIFVKTKNKLIHDVIVDRLSTPLYKEVEENGLVVLENVERTDSDFLEHLIDGLSDYYANDFLEDVDRPVKEIVREKFDENIAKKP